MSQIWNFKFSTSYLKKETVEINFNNLTQYIQNAIISTYNHYKTFNEIFSSHFSIVFKTVCVLHDDSPRLVTFQVLNSYMWQAAIISYRTYVEGFHEMWNGETLVLCFSDNYCNHSKPLFFFWVFGGFVGLFLESWLISLWTEVALHLAAFLF